MINQTDHSIEISWSLTTITGRGCDSISAPPLMYRVTAETRLANEDFYVAIEGVRVRQ